jgi:hypothetical protein
MFEAGAISRSVDRPRLCTVLFGIEPTDIQGPLERFQATRFLKEDIHKLLKTINSNAKDEALPDATLDGVFNKWWPDLEHDVNEITKAAGSSTKVEVRDQCDLLQEVLGLTRVMAEQQSQIREMVGELSSTDKAATVLGAMMRAYNEPPTGQLGDAGAVLGAIMRLKKSSPTDEVHTAKETSTVDPNKPNEQKNSDRSK